MNAKGKNIIPRLASLGVHLQKIPFLDQAIGCLTPKFLQAQPLNTFWACIRSKKQLPKSQFHSSRHPKGKKALDVAAAPGGKTVQFADSMENSGAIVALDVDKRRLNALSNHLERCHVSNTVVYLLDARQAPMLKFKFDRVLVDAPCSGNFASDKDWFKNRTLKDVERNAGLQREILTKAVECMSDEGEMVYSTCSLEPEEDELNIDWAIKNLNLQTEQIYCQGEKGLTNIFGKQLDPSIKHCRRLWPGETQGFFVCKLKKRSPPC